MAIHYTVQLEQNEWGQLLEGIGNRSEAWAKTAEYLTTGKLPDGDIFVIEECSDAQEASEISQWYLEIIEKIRVQMAAQR